MNQDLNRQIWKRTTDASTSERMTDAVGVIWDICCNVTNAVREKKTKKKITIKTPRTMEQETKVCRCCGRELPMSNFKKGRWGVVSVCNECDKQHRAENRQARIERAKQKVDDVRAENRQLCLADFTPRELMMELKRRGYEGKITYVETHTIDLSTL